VNDDQLKKLDDIMIVILLVCMASIPLIVLVAMFSMIWFFPRIP
jgi:heme/copper-type cytochrome/quinol oxidase subunit 2